MSTSKNISVQETSVAIWAHNGEGNIRITGMAKAKSDDSRAADVIKNWMRNRTTLEFLGTWEKIYNPNFKVVEFDHFETEARLHSLVLISSLRLCANRVPTRGELR